MRVFIFFIILIFSILIAKPVGASAPQEWKTIVTILTMLLTQIGLTLLAIFLTTKDEPER